MFPCKVCDCSNATTSVYPESYFFPEDQRIEDKRIKISHPEIRTASGHRFISNADRISVLRKNIIQCK